MSDSQERCELSVKTIFLPQQTLCAHLEASASLRQPSPSGRVSPGITECAQEGQWPQRQGKGIEGGGGRFWGRAWPTSSPVTMWLASLGKGLQAAAL